MDISENLYPEYTCSRNAPLKCDRPTETAQEIKGAKFCLDCSFPAILPLPATLDGQRGNYQATSLVGIRGMGRLYAGTNLKDGQPVTIKSYWRYDDYRRGTLKSIISSINPVDIDWDPQLIKFINHPEAGIYNQHVDNYIATFISSVREELQAEVDAITLADLEFNSFSGEVNHDDNDEIEKGGYK